MKKLALSLLIFSLAFTSVYAQKVKMPKPPFKVTKAQMYEDYDQFLHIVETYCGHIELRLKTGYDIMGILRERRAKIENIKNYWEFIQFMDRSVYKILDMHAQKRDIFYNPPHPRYAPGESFYDSSYISYISNGLEQYYDYINQKNPFKNYDNWLFSTGARYIDGQYYCADYLNFRNPHSNDSICFQNTRIVACDKLPADIYVRERLFNELRPWALLWDVKREKYFTPSFLINYSKPFKVVDEDSSITYDFIPKHYGIRMQTSGNKEFRYKEDWSDAKQWPKQFATYFPEQKILYIYTEMMRPQRRCYDSLCDSIIVDYSLYDSIIKVGAGKEIDKVICDVRNNQGGGDGFWYDMLAHIIKNPITFKHNIALNYNDEVKAYLLAEFPPEMTKDYTKDTIAFLDNKIMYVNHTVATIFPEENSLQYDGKIYILQGLKTYSAAHSFSSLARQVPQLVSIGVSTGQLAGFGLNPWGFQLKNSHYTFSFEPALDITNAEKWEDVFQCVPEIEIEPTLKDINNEVYRLFMSPEEYLIKYDYLFKYIMNLND